MAGRARRRAGDRGREARRRSWARAACSSSRSTRPAARCRSSTSRSSRAASDAAVHARPGRRGATLKQDGADRVRVDAAPSASRRSPSSRRGDAPHSSSPPSDRCSTACAHSSARPRASRRSGSSRRASRCCRCTTSSTTAAASSWSSAPRRPTSQSGVRVGDVVYRRATPAAARSASPTRRCAWRSSRCSTTRT